MGVGAHAVKRALPAALATAVMVLGAPAAGLAAVTFTRVGTIPGTGGAVYAFVRTANGTLHIVRPTSDNGAQGLTADAITPAARSRLRPPLSPLTGGCRSGRVPRRDGSLEAFFGAGDRGERYARLGHHLV